MTSFFDSNVLLYLLDTSQKKQRTEELLRQQGVVSVQVLNEFIEVSRRKFKLPTQVAVAFLKPISERCKIVDLTLDTHKRAIEIIMTTNLGIYDANIIAAAELSGCNVLYSEDMSHGQKIGSVSIFNPFVVLRSNKP